MNFLKWDVRAGTYYDSVVLMQLQRGLAALPGVIDAGVVMATAANRDLLAAGGLLPESVAAQADDLLVVVRADSEHAAADAIAQVPALLARRRSPQAPEDFRPRSLGAAIKLLPEAGWVLVSVPGRHAAGVAREALDLGRHVFLYSDNVPLDEEIALKTTARGRGLMVMGPDCGTAVINGIGMGFANRIRRGSIGVIGASGTGLQAVTSQIHNLGGGISHAIGTGGRDLRSEVGAITSLQALDVLARDAETQVIVMISKPPAPPVAASWIAAARAAGKPVVVNFIGHPPAARRIGNLFLAVSLGEAARLAVEQLARPEPARPLPPADPLRGCLRGLFSGGTLAYEALLGLQACLSPIFSNAPIGAHQALEDPLRSRGHCLIDLGDEFFMVGRLHPMIDNDLRIRRMRQEADDPETGMILFDLVLGEGSHPDPAGELAAVLREIRARRPQLEFVGVVIGTEADPQDVDGQVERLREAGAVVFRDLTEAVDHVSLRFTRARPYAFPPVDLESLARPFAAVNVGLESFHASLVGQGAQAVQLDWRPPAGGDEKLASLLSRMKK